MQQSYMVRVLEVEQALGAVLIGCHWVAWGECAEWEAAGNEAKARPCRHTCQCAHVPVSCCPMQACSSGG